MRFLHRNSKHNHVNCWTGMQESVRKREGSREWMEGVERTERGRAVCVHMCERVHLFVWLCLRERERERARDVQYTDPQHLASPTLCRVGEIQQSIKLTVYKNWIKHNRRYSQWTRLLESGFPDWTSWGRERFGGWAKESGARRVGESICRL